MTDSALRDDLRGRLAELRQAGLYKHEHVIETPQSAHVGVTGRGEVLNLCANNYLGLADHPEIVAKPGVGHADVQSSTTLPDCPEPATANPSANSSKPIRWVMTGAMLSPD